MSKMVVLVISCLVYLVACANGFAIQTGESSSFGLKPMRIDIASPSQFTLEQHGKCDCVENVCGCCAYMDIEKLNFNHTGCLNFTYSPNDFAIQLDLLLSNHSIFNARISGRNPPALCIPIPQLPILAMCIKLSDIHTDDQFLYACLSMELQLNGFPLVVFNFDCAKLGHNGIILVKPTPKTPIDGQFDMNLSLANLEEALRNKTTALIPSVPSGWPNLFQLNLAPKLNNDTITKIVEAVNNIVKNQTDSNL